MGPSEYREEWNFPEGVCEVEGCKWRHIMGAGVSGKAFLVGNARNTFERSSEGQHGECTCNPSTQETKAGGSLVSRQPSETVSQKQTDKQANTAPLNSSPEYYADGLG